jgi:hypothetical protein
MKANKNMFDGLSEKDQQTISEGASEQFIRVVSVIINDMSSRAPSDPNDWARIDAMMHEVLSQMTDLYSELVFVVSGERKAESNAKFWSLNLFYMAFMAILTAHFSVIAVHGRGKEAHLHFDRIISSLKKLDTQVVIVKLNSQEG